MATEDYIAVTGDDWYQRRRQDAEGDFFRKVSDQAGRGSRDSSGGSTRQGIYCLTADGRLLAYKNAGQNPDVMRDVMRQGLANWRKLPEADRRPGAAQVAEAGRVDARYSRTPPAGGLVINVYARCLDRGADGEYCDASCATGDEAGRDHLWLTADEWKSLIPSGGTPGDRFPMPAAIAQRIARFHLIDNTRGEPPLWSRNDVRTSEWSIVIEKSDAAGVTLRVEGLVLLAAGADPATVQRGYDAKLFGYIQYDAKQRAVTRFDMVAIGDHWGEGTYTRGARPGRTPLGVAFELAKGNSPADRVPPQAAREIGEYFEVRGR